METLKEIITSLQKKEISSVELLQTYLARISNAKILNTLISIDEDYAMQQAKLADNLIQNGNNKLFTGIPLAHKDIFCTNNLTTTCGSKMLANFQSPYQATIVNKLEEQGAITLGKTNMDEFAMGSSNETSYFGAVKNPWDINCVPGGSSGGSAAAVAARLIPFATGSDTGGSIRQPAAFCGISGIKPTYGLVSRFGMVAFASSLDQAGPMAHTAEDLALILKTMAGFDPNDSTSVNQPVKDYTATLNSSLEKVRIGLPRGFFDPNVDIFQQKAIEEAIKLFEKAGAEIIDIDLPLQSLWVPCYYVIACAEASSNLSRYDGVRFGHRSKHQTNLKELITCSRMEGFGNEVKRRILTGTHVLSSGYFDAYYLQALKIRRLIKNEFQQQFNTVDVILGPTTQDCAFKLGERFDSPIKNYLADVFTVAANLVGLPAMSIPVGFKDHMPLGMQLMGNHFKEDLLLNVAHQYQQMTNWHQIKPTEY